MTNADATTTPTTPTTYRSRTLHVQAVQWLDTDDSLRAVQSLLFPLSPFRPPVLDNPLTPGTKIGVPCSQANGLYDLKFVEPGCWVVVSASRRVTVMADSEFREMHVAVDEPLDLTIGDLGEGLRDA